MSRLRLANGDWAVELAPELGGALTALTRGGRDILRPAAADARAPLDLACFPLVPYANRIAHGRFAFDGVEHHLPRNYPGQAHPLHGVGWLAPWSIREASDASALLRHEHAGDDAWPWPYQAEQRVQVTAAGVSLSLSLTAGAAMPVSLGFHPYFTKAGVQSLAFASQGLWQVDAGLLPTTLAPANTLGDWRGGGALERPDLIDNSYTGWDGTALIRREDGDVLLAATGADVLHLYLPPGEPFFCAEPTTAMPDALNRAPERLAAGETRTVVMTLRSA